jgi:hypothetical protein
MFELLGKSCCIAQTRDEYLQAFKLLADGYFAHGFDKVHHDIKFMPAHCLPDTRVFLAKHGDEVIGTMSLVIDNGFHPLPIDRIYPEVAQFRKSGTKLGEMTCVAIKPGVSRAETMDTFVALVSYATQYFFHLGLTKIVAAVNPAHHGLYIVAFGFVQIGPRRPYPDAGGAEAEAVICDLDMFSANAPVMYKRVYAERLPPAAFVSRPMPQDDVLFFTYRVGQIHAAQP